MPIYTAFDPDSTMIGRTAYGMIKSIMHDDIAPILAKHHLDQIAFDQWYPVQDLLNVFNDVADSSENVSPIFVSIGMGAAEIGYEALPPALKSMPLETFLDAYGKRLNELHHGDVGYVTNQKADKDHFVISMKTPYPDDVMYGVFYGYARFLKPANKFVSMTYDSSQPRREQGGDVTIIHILIKD